MAFNLQRLVPSFLRPSNASLSNPDREILEALIGMSNTASGVTVTPIKAMAVSTVYACVNRIAGTVASLPLKLYRRGATGSVEEATDHPLYRLMHSRPNDEMTSVTFRRTMQANKSLRNVSYAFIVRNGLGEVTDLTPIAPQDITLERATSNSPLVYRVRGTIVQASQILHLKGLSMDGVVPMDLVGTAREAIALAIVLQDNAARFFSNSSRPGAVLEHPGKLSPEAAKRLRESFEKNYKGSENAYKVALLEEGLKLASNRAHNTDSQFEESRKRQALEITQFFGLPPHKVGILDNATFSNIEEQNLEYVVDTIGLEVAEWEQTLNNQLLNPEEQKTLFFAFKMEGLLRGAIATRYAAYAIGRNWGWLSPNDIRRMENLNPIKGGDAYDIPPNSATNITDGQQAPSDPKQKQNDKKDEAKNEFPAAPFHYHAPPEAPKNFKLVREQDGSVKVTSI